MNIQLFNIFWLIVLSPPLIDETPYSQLGQGVHNDVFLHRHLKEKSLLLATLRYKANTCTNSIYGMTDVDTHTFYVDLATTMSIRTKDETRQLAAACTD